MLNSPVMAQYGYCDRVRQEVRDMTFYLIGMIEYRNPNQNDLAKLISRHQIGLCDRASSHGASCGLSSCVHLLDAEATSRCEEWQTNESEMERCESPKDDILRDSRWPLGSNGSFCVIRG